METVVSLDSGGIVCSVGAREFHLDPRRSRRGGTVFVSHAHADHLPPTGTDALASSETRALASIRGVRLGCGGETDAVMVDSGHILGSRGLLVGDVFYTGDICTRDRGFMRRARIPRCRTLITECTFGLPGFSFPDISEVAHRANRIIAEAFARGRPVVMMGHELGKAQILTHLFGSWAPLYVHDSVKRINDAYRAMGVGLREAPGHSEAASGGLLDRPPWLMIAPMPSARNGVAAMCAEHNAVTVAFSGWAGSDHPAGRRRADHVIPMSDHCDFGELVRAVRQSGAERVYTTHGFADEFSSHLKSIGIDAVPLCR